MCDEYILISVKPKHAEKLFDGTKKFELRRTRPLRLKEGDGVIVYVSSPVMAVLGGFTANGVIEATPEDLWEMVQHSSGLSRTEFDLYYSGCNEAVGIKVDDPWTLEQPVPLNQIRNIWPGFQPPQIFCYLSEEQVASIKEAPVA